MHAGFVYGAIRLLNRLLRRLHSHRAGQGSMAWAAQFRILLGDICFCQNGYHANTKLLDDILPVKNNVTACLFPLDTFGFHGNPSRDPMENYHNIRSACEIATIMGPSV